jgi:hypothetical protein
MARTYLAPLLYALAVPLLHVQVVFDEALGEDDDEDDDDEDKGFATRDGARFSGPQAPQVPPRRSQFQLAQEAMSNDESEAFYAMAARARGPSTCPNLRRLRPLQGQLAATHAKGDKRQYADLIHMATILEAVHSGDDRLRATWSRSRGGFGSSSWWPFRVPASTT